MNDSDHKAGVCKCAGVFPALGLPGSDPQNLEQTGLSAAVSMIVPYCHQAQHFLHPRHPPIPRLLPASLPPTACYVFCLVGTALYPPHTISYLIWPQATNKPTPQTTVTRLYPGTHNIPRALLEVGRWGTWWADNAGREGGSCVSPQGLKEAVGEGSRPEDKVLLQTLSGASLFSCPAWVLPSACF